ncbi:MAG: MBL fold metallo-hydrolase [Chloroflexi bacterium]|nr:MBL fold metallo-hydrolase [Chloroflexota bacterium]
MEEVAPNIHRLVYDPEPRPGALAANSWMVIGRTATALVDTGWNRPEEVKARLEYIQRVRHSPIRYIAITHRHGANVGGASAIQKAYGGVIVSTPMEKEFVDAALEGTSVGKTVQDGETVSLGGLTLEFIHASGHTFGSLGVFLREQRALFTGDNVMGVGTSVINPGQGEISQFMATMEKFLRYNAQVIYPGQGPVVKDPRAKLEELIAHRKERENQVLAQLATGPKTVEELFRAIYTDLDERRHNMARNQVRSQLAKLQQEGRVTTPDNGETYRLA